MEKNVQIWHNTKIPCYFSTDWKPERSFLKYIVLIQMVATEEEAMKICLKFNLKNAPKEFLEKT